MVTEADVPQTVVYVGQVIHPPPGGVEAWVVDRENPIGVEVIAQGEYEVTHVTSTPRAHGGRDVILVLVIISPIPDANELKPYKHSKSQVNLYGAFFHLKHQRFVLIIGSAFFIGHTHANCTYANCTYGNFT